MHLYTASQSIGLASHIALEESGLPYELTILQFAQHEQTSSSYVKINPKARVPSLVVDGIVLTETLAILAFIAQMSPNSILALPDNSMDFAQIQSFNSFLCSTVHVAHAHKMRGKRWVDDEHALKALTANVPVTMAKCFAMLEAEYVMGPWVFGDKYSICDPYLFAISSWFESDGVDINNYPKIKAHRELMLERTAVQSALAALA